MKVADKITLLQKGVKFSEIAELEKQELEELNQELKDSEEEEQTLKEEKKDVKEEKAEKSASKESKEEAKESKEEAEENEELIRLQEENKKMKELLHKANILNSGTEKGKEPKKKLTPVDVMNQLFHPEENGGKK